MLTLQWQRQKDGIPMKHNTRHTPLRKIAIALILGIMCAAPVTTVLAEIRPFEIIGGAFAVTPG